MVVTTLEMYNFDNTKTNIHFKMIHSLSMGGAHLQVAACIASSNSSPYVVKQFMAVFHTQPLFQHPCVMECNTNEKLGIVVKATGSTGAQSPTRLSM